MSATLVSAPASAPATKPSCTAVVGQAADELVSPHSPGSDGGTADIENQSPMISSSAAESASRVRHFCVNYAPGVEDSGYRIAYTILYPPSTVGVRLSSVGQNVLRKDGS